MSQSANKFNTNLSSGNKKVHPRVRGLLIMAMCLSPLGVLAAQYQQGPQSGGTYQPPSGDPQYQGNGDPRYQGNGGGDPQYQGGEYPQGQPPYQPGPPPYQQGPPPNQEAQAPYLQQPPVPSQPVPAILTMPAGTVITARVTQFLSSDRNHPGDEFSAVLEQPVIVNGWVVARPGQTVVGRVSVAEKSHAGGKSQLGVELTNLVLVDGQQLPLKTQMMQASGGNIPAGQTVATVAIPTGIGAAIGAAAGGWRHSGEGAGIGAAAGAAAGIIGVLLTPGRPTVIPPEALVTFRQESPLNISTVRSSQAFQPVSQQDYRAVRNRLQNGPRMAAPGYPPPPPPNPYSYYGGYYPSPYGPYFYGFGPNFSLFFGPRFGGYRFGGFRR